MDPDASDRSGLVRTPCYFLSLFILVLLVKLEIREYVDVFLGTDLTIRILCMVAIVEGKSYSAWRPDTRDNPAGPRPVGDRS